MKIACITDTHISFKKSNQVFHNYFEKFYNDIFFPELQKRKIKTVIHLGDAFDNRKGIDYWGLEWAQRVVYDKFKELGITVYQICGNHDVQLRTTNKYNAIETLLRDYDNIIPITSPSVYDIDDVKTLFVPWICKENEDETFKLTQETSAKLLFGHLELSGFTLFPGQLSTHGIGKERFNKFDRVFSGHYHARSNDGKVFYLGNPYQMFWSDVNDKRGFNIFDNKTYELEFIENPYSLYEKIYYSNNCIEDFDVDNLKEKYIKVIVKNKSNETQYNTFISKLKDLDIVDLKIVDTEIIGDMDIDLSEIDPEDTLATLNKYIEEVDFSLNRDMVKKILQGIYQEALELEV
jgi:DNA repair exonuclease SbcCD nuclease subunit